MSSSKGEAVLDACIKLCFKFTNFLVLLNRADDVTVYAQTFHYNQKQGEKVAANFMGYYGEQSL